MFKSFQTLLYNDWYPSWWTPDTCAEAQSTQTSRSNSLCK
jgi:hypothetical protein